MWGLYIFYAASRGQWKWQTTRCIHYTGTIKTANHQKYPLLARDVRMRTTCNIISIIKTKMQKGIPMLCLSAFCWHFLQPMTSLTKSLKPTTLLLTTEDRVCESSLFQDIKMEFQDSLLLLQKIFKLLLYSYEKIPCHGFKNILYPY